MNFGKGMLYKQVSISDFGPFAESYIRAQSLRKRPSCFWGRQALPDVGWGCFPEWEAPDQTPMEQMWTGRQPGEVVRGTGATGLAPMEQRWTGRQPGEVVRGTGATGQTPTEHVKLGDSWKARMMCAVFDRNCAHSKLFLYHRLGLPPLAEEIKIFIQTEENKRIQWKPYVHTDVYWEKRYQERKAARQQCKRIRNWLQQLAYGLQHRRHYFLSLTRKHC